MTDTTEQGVVETPAPDANALPETPVETPEVQQGVSDSSPDVADADDSADKPKGGFQRRIGELTRNWRETERDRDYWRDLALQNLRPTPEPQPEPVEQPRAAPEPVKTLADFNYDEAQFATYLRDQAVAEARRAAADALREERERETAQRREQSFKERVDNFKKSAPDFDDLVLRNRSLPITADMAQVIRESEDGPAVAYYLGKNPGEAARIAQLGTVAAARELGKIEARLAFEREQASKPVVTPKPAVSQAPPPPPKIEAAEPEVEKDPDKMPVDEWLRWRNKQLSRKRK